MTTREEILYKVEKAFQVTEEQLNYLVVGINEEMRAGLNIDRSMGNYKTSELKMIPSYVVGTHLDLHSI